MATPRYQFGFTVTIKQPDGCWGEFESHLRADSEEEARRTLVGRVMSGDCHVVGVVVDYRQALNS